MLLEKATKTLGELNAFTLFVPEVELFIPMHVVKEANTSSRTETDEAVPNEEAVHPERRDDWRKVRNDVHAMNSAIDEL